jgi:hypothetical protein
MMGIVLRGAGRTKAVETLFYEADLKVSIYRLNVLSSLTWDDN